MDVILSFRAPSIKYSGVWKLLIKVNEMACYGFHAFVMTINDNVEALSPWQ